MNSSKYDFSHLSGKTSEEILRDTLSYASGNEALDKQTAKVLFGSLAVDRPDLVPVWFEEVGPEQAELDLHLEGDGVTGHSTDAFSFAKFIQNVAESVKEIAKSATGLKRYPHNLLVEGAAPGSVRVVLKAPPVRKGQSEALLKEDTSSADSDALKKVARLFAAASEHSNDDVLDSLLHGTSLPAREALRKATRVVTNASWDIRGTIAQKRLGLQETQLTHRGAVALEEAIGRETTEEEVLTVVGILDGLKASVGVVWIEPEKGKPFAASVASDELFARVASLLSGGASPPIRATIRVIQTLSSTDGAGIRASRELLSIEPRFEQDQFDIM